ncbi:retrovirus-related Pol polyprotein from transposon 297 [Trichonephila clavipes]|nr:retrovirus-related Pol polyprotein from transposon 297 [Trichonephila clavipes]
MADPEIKPILEFKESADEKPSRQDIAPFHPATKRYWALWDSLHLRKGVLYQNGSLTTEKQEVQSDRPEQPLLVSSNQQDWDKKLSLFRLTYRSAVHETAGYSPSQMLFGPDLRLPADLLFSRPPDAPLAPEEYIEKLSLSLQAWMEEMHHLTRERIGMTSEKMKTRYGARST